MQIYIFLNITEEIDRMQRFGLYAKYDNGYHSFDFLYRFVCYVYSVRLYF